MRYYRVQYFVLVLLMSGGQIGCSTTGTRTATRDRAQDSVRSPLEAERLALAAGECMYSDPHRAEQLLSDAIRADLFCGPAHNNLGVLYLSQGKLYEAAGEFEWARKLMPGHPDPRLNLGLTLELAGKTDDALETYRTALEAGPEHIQTIQALTRLQLRSRRPSSELRQQLEEIALRGDSTEWREWAAEQLAMLR